MVAEPKIVLIIGCFHSLNSGVMAMAESLVQKHSSDLVYVFSSERFGKIDEERYSVYENVKIHVPQWRRGTKLGKLLAYSGLFLGRLMGDTRRLVEEAEYIYDISGDSISSDYGDLDAVIQLLPALAMTNYSRNVYMAPQSLGPFHSWWLSYMVRRLLNNVAGYSAREETSAKIVRSLGLECEVHSDLANDLNPREIELPFLCNDDVVAVGVSNLISSYGEIDSRTYFGAIVEKILDHGYKAFLVTHVTYPHSNDALLAKDIKNQLFSSEDRVEVAARNYRASEWKYILGHCRAIITARMHPAVLTLSQGGIALNLAYNHKSLGVVKEAYFPRGDVVDFKDYDLVLERVENLLSSLPRPDFVA